MKLNLINMTKTCTHFIHHNTSTHMKQSTFNYYHNSSNYIIPRRPPTKNSSIIIPTLIPIVALLNLHMINLFYITNIIPISK
ncbi:hypothetical protein E2I00_005515 [Balaenoptera physalus]|uniref:Uncharacterized protein n=1 Tax=Balaenoptera physalus TaxID=9770 RepID=A0A6A1QAK7_BALPH|nr:hypothetical protein E2I00_005515 [Balaenoptera physalus]